MRPASAVRSADWRWTGALVMQSPSRKRSFYSRRAMIPAMFSFRPARFVLAAALCAGAWPALLAPLDADKPLADRVVIRRDTFGVPHITGETEAAVAFGFGYAQAEDHAAEMARRFLGARGDAARHLGPAYLDGDLAARRWDNIGASRRAMASLDGTFRDVLEGFAGGLQPLRPPASRRAAAVGYRDHRRRRPRPDPHRRPHRRGVGRRSCARCSRSTGRRSAPAARGSADARWIREPR